MVDVAPTPKKRRPRAELKELMIEAGVDVLAEHGIEMQISSVSYAKVFEHLERTKDVRVTYGSVHERIWNSLQDYQLAVIERAGLWDNSTSADVLNDEVAALIAAADLESTEGRKTMLKEGWRLAGKAAHKSTEADDGWTSWVKTVVSMSTQPEGTVVRDAARTGSEVVYENLTKVNTEVISGAIDLTRRAPRDFLPADVDTAEIMVRLAIAVSEGLDFRTMLTGEQAPTYTLNTGPGGIPEEWDLFGLVMWAITNGLLKDAEDPS